MTEGTNTQNTEYLDGFQYTQEVLDFFPHQEGYVKVVSAQGVGGSSSFNYVFTYTDHLGNIRLRYTKTETQGLAILEENHYYPFGLKHNGYNSDHKIFEFNDGTNTVVLTPVTPSRKETYKYKFQGQELSEELGYNMYEYKYRHYDASIGRFVSIDPLANTYVNNSTYAFQENKLGLGTEVEGKEMELHEWLVREGTTYVAKELDKKMTDAGMKKTEKSVASKELYKMYKLKKSGNKEKAENFAYNTGLPGLEDGPADAFRHSLFNALNAQTVGESFTKELGVAHEEDRPTQKKSSKKMDLFNNEVGREIGKHNPDASVFELATTLLDKMEDGELVSIDSKGNVVKTKLSKSDKSKILKNLQKLNENGLTSQQQAAQDKKEKKDGY